MICPSYPPAAAELEIGFRHSDESVQFHSVPVAITPTTRVNVARYELNNQASGRYAGKCVTSECANWADGCRLGRRLAHEITDSAEPCSIAGSCRWFNENGPVVCGACASVIYFA